MSDCAAAREEEEDDDDDDDDDDDEEGLNVFEDRLGQRDTMTRVSPWRASLHL
tara:strand:+ start:996 stop:1154 length:159 start_codon:yes stop_codon:yes gene_type:complete